MPLLETVNCRNCGSHVHFDPEESSTKCISCGHVLRRGVLWHSWAQRLAPRARPIENAATGNLIGREVCEARTIPCKNCGVELSFPPDIKSYECPFCCSTLVLDSAHIVQHAEVSAIIPFSISEQQALDALHHEIKEFTASTMVVSEIARRERKVKFQGVYLSFYLFDVDVRGKFEIWKRKGSIIRQTKSGDLIADFRDIVVPGSDTLGVTANIADHLNASWDLSKLERFNAGYLSGFRAALPAINAAEARQRYRHLIDAKVMARAGIAMPVGKAEVVKLQVDEDPKMRLILLPVWLASYHERGETYRIVVNGQTGVVGVEVPSPPLNLRYLWYCLIAAAVIMVIMTIIELMT